jgi:3-oxoacyl-[acyl-carrier protein] reductase
MGNLAKPHKALITGSTRGIGAAIASLLKSEGINVVTPHRDELDLSNPASVAAFIASRKNDEIDILINNAGINLLNEIVQIEDENWQSMLRVNLTAPMELIRGLSPFMKFQQWGRIVNISSIFSLVTREKRAAYSAAKSGLNGLTRSAAVELAPYGVLVNAVCPGYVETELTHANNSPEQLAKIAGDIPIQRLAKPEEISKFVSFLCSEDNTYLTGQTLVIDGGFICQ